MPEEIEVLRINIILPEDSENILALAPKDVDTKKKDKVKKWIEKSFKNMERLKLNLGGELDAEGFFGMENISDNHPDKVLLCVYSKNKVKMSSFMASLNTVTFRPATGKKDRSSYSEKRKSSKNWRAKLTRSGNYIRHTEMIRFRKILKKSIKREKLVARCQTPINCDMLKYYKPYVVDRYDRTKPILKSLIANQSNIFEYPCLTKLKKERRLHETFKNNDLTGPVTLRPIFEMSPLECRKVVQQTVSTMNRNRSYRKNPKQKIPHALDSRKDSKKNEKQYCKELKKGKKTCKQILNYIKKYTKYENVSNENNVDKKIESITFDANEDKCKILWSRGREQLNDLYNFVKPKFCDSISEDSYYRNSITSKEKLFLSRRNRNRSSSKSVLNNINRKNIKQLEGILSAKSNRSIGVQTNSRIALKRTKEEDRNCNGKKIDKACSVRSRKAWSTEFQNDGNSKVARTRMSYEITAKENRCNSKIDKDIDGSSSDDSRVADGLKRNKNRKKHCSCHKCLKKRNPSQRSVSSYKNDEKFSPKYKRNVSFHDISCSNLDKTPRVVGKHKSQSDSEDNIGKRSLFKKLFTRCKNNKKSKFFKGNNVRYYRQIFMEEESDYDRTGSEIIKVKFHDGFNKRRQRSINHPCQDRTTQSSVEDFVDIISLNRNRVCDHCGHPIRSKPIQCSQVIDSLEFIKKARAKKNDKNFDPVTSFNSLQESDNEFCNANNIVNFTSSEYIVAENRKTSSFNIKNDGYDSIQSLIDIEEKQENFNHMSSIDNDITVQHLLEVDLKTNSNNELKSPSRTMEKSDMDQIWTNEENDKKEQVKHQDTDEITHKVKCSIIDHWMNMTPNLLPKARNRRKPEKRTVFDKNHYQGNEDKEHDERRPLLSVISMVQIRTEELNLNESSVKQQNIDNNRFTENEFHEEPYSQEEPYPQEEPYSFLPTSNSLEAMSAVVNANRLNRLSNDKKRLFKISSDTLIKEIENNEMDRANPLLSSSSMIKTLNKTLKSILSTNKLNTFEKTVTDKSETLKNSDQDKFQEKGKFVKNSVTVSRDRAKLSLVEKKIEATKAKERRQIKEPAFKRRQIPCPRQEIIQTMRDKRLLKYAK